MVQQLIINVDSDKPLSSYGEGHMIIYDSRKRNYYVQSREDFLRPQNEKIEKLNLEFEKAKKELTRQFNQEKDSLEKRNEVMTREFNSLKSKFEKQYNDFIKTYQETNKQLIEMVKSVVLEEK